MPLKEEMEVVEIVEPEDESQVQVIKEQAASSSQVQEVHEVTQLPEEDLQQDKDKVIGSQLTERSRYINTLGSNWN